VLVSLCFGVSQVPSHVTIDLKILLWDFYQEDVREPVGMFVGPRVLNTQFVIVMLKLTDCWQTSILSLTFSVSNRYIFT